MNNNHSESAATDHGMMPREEVERILNRLGELRNTPSYTRFVVSSFWSSDIRWARNSANMTSDRRGVLVFASCTLNGTARAIAYSNQVDDASLEGLVRSVERKVRQKATIRSGDSPLEIGDGGKSPETATWSDRTINRSVEESAEIVKYATSMAQEKDYMSAGYIESHGMTVGSRAFDAYDRIIESKYSAMTQAACTVTVRNSEGSASGWAGLARYDLDKIDERALAAIAFEKCIASVNPVRIEPGRYTAILEPQAVAEFVHPMLDSGEVYNANRLHAEDQTKGNPYFFGTDEVLNRDVSKLGLKIVDERITISHNPLDPELGVIASPTTGPLKWIDKGVLTELAFGGAYNLVELNDKSHADRRLSFRMEGGSATIDDMIAGTKRGLLVSRFYKLGVVDRRSILMSGVTRDGLWLIEDGKISKPVRNFRISESPIFALNNVEQLGIPTPVYRPFHIRELAPLFPEFALTQAIVPALKINDFSFTSSIDAI